MGLACCLPIKHDDDHPIDDNSDASLSRNPFSSGFRHSLFNKVKGVFHRNEVLVTQHVQRQEIINANAHRVHPNYVQNPPEIDVISDKPAAFINRPITSEILDTSSSYNHPIVENEQNQTSEQNLEAGSVLIPDAAATSEVTAETLNTSSCNEHHHQSSEQNSVALGAAVGRDSVSVTEEVTAEMLNTSSCHENHHQSSEQNPETDDSAAVSLQSSEGGLHSETVIDNSCTKETTSENIKKTFTNANGVFYEVFPSSDEEDVCPTCLEDYEPENPKIVAECSHHFHLSCIYDWLERSERCPICFRMMVINEN